MTHRAATKRRKTILDKQDLRAGRGWIAQMQEWRVSALARVRSQLEHLCSGPGSRPKSFCINEAVHNVVAQDYDPESPLGILLYDLLMEDIAGQIARRADLLSQLQTRVPASEDREFMIHYLSSSWWIDNFLQLEQVCCRDVVQAVDAAISDAMQEHLHAAA